MPPIRPNYYRRLRILQLSQLLHSPQADTASVSEPQEPKKRSRKANSEPLNEESNG